MLVPEARSHLCLFIIRKNRDELLAVLIRRFGKGIVDAFAEPTY
jgi:hypothetical protein